MMPDRMVHHPLDVDLLDFVEGTADAVTTERVDRHARACVICRIKVQRLRKTPPVELTPLADPTIPSYRHIEVDELTGEAAAPGEFWLTAEDAALIVLIRSLRSNGSGVVVAPVVADIEVADGGTTILGDAISPIGVPIAIFDELTVSVPVEALKGRLVTIDGRADALSALADTEVTHGRPIEDTSDPRLEIRQHLIDRLTNLQRPLPPDRQPPQAHPRHGALRNELEIRRGTVCLVDPLDHLPTLPGDPDAWHGLARITEAGIQIIVIETPVGLNETSDFIAAQALVARLNASALVVATTLTDSVDLHEPRSLFGGHRLPDGRPNSEPVISGLDLSDTVAKYLDQKTRTAFSPASPSTKAEQVDVNTVLAQSTTHAIEEKVRRALRQGEEKKQGALRLQTVNAELTEALKAALRPDFNTENIARIVGTDDQ